MPSQLEEVPAHLWRRVQTARHRLLMLDYDGTLAPFHVDRDRAVPLPRTLEILKAIAAEARTRLAIVSGRPLLEMEHLVGPLAATLVGEHGWEERLPDGVVERCPLSPEQAALLDRAETLVRTRTGDAELERKRTGVVFHTRGLPPALARTREDEVAAVWGPLAAEGGIRLEHTDGGLELRLHERNKGTAVLSLIARAPTGVLGVFVGDDVTDEDAFAAVRPWGFGVRVGATDRPSLATARLLSCTSVSS
jgi:trehalose 6-phosphate phosphatase